MNILIIGSPNPNLITLIKESKYFDKIYIASNEKFDKFPNIEYRTFDELIQKAIAIKTDIAINTKQELINDGIVEAFESSKINLISVNKKWLNLEQSRLSAKQLLNHYKINTPERILAPLNFPIMLKTDTPEACYKIISMQDLITKMQELKGQVTFLEEYLGEEKFKIYLIWDHENIKIFYDEDNLTEVQKDRLDLLKTKLNFMFSDENADFTGIFTINLAWYKNDWYVINFDTDMNISQEAFRNIDFVYLLNSAIYQKLNEV